MEKVRRKLAVMERNPFTKISCNLFLRIKQQEEDEMRNIGDWDSEL